MLKTRFDQRDYWVTKNGAFLYIRDMSVLDLMKILTDLYLEPVKIIKLAIADLTEGWWTPPSVVGVSASINAITSMNLDEVLQYFSMCVLTTEIISILEKEGVNVANMLSLECKQQLRWIEISKSSVEEEVE